MRDSRGRRHLVHVLQFTTAREVARRCRVHPSQVTRWASGETRPSAAAREALDRVYGVASGSWGVNRNQVNRQPVNRP